jgi:hypothetical protein
MKGYGEISESLDTEVERKIGKSMQGEVFGFWLLLLELKQIRANTLKLRTKG